MPAKLRPLIPMASKEDSNRVASIATLHKVSKAFEVPFFIGFRSSFKDPYKYGQ